VRVGIIGCGHIAEVHGQIIKNQHGVEIVGIVDNDISRAEAMAKKLDSEHFYQNAERMIIDKKPDVVHVLVPPQYHAAVSMIALKSGCHVLVEKPMALSLKDAVEMVKVATINNVKICVNHNLLFDKTIRKVKEMVSSGALGRVLTVEANFMFNARRYPEILEEGAQYCHWTYRMKGGPIQDLIPHPASLLFEFIHDIQEIKHIGRNRGVLPNGWHDELKLLINSSDITGYLNLSLSEKPDTITFCVRGSKGFVQADLYSNTLVVRKESALPRAVNRGISGFQIGTQVLIDSMKNVGRFLTGRIDKSSGIEALITYFYVSIRNKTEPPISTDKSLRVVELMDKIWPEQVLVAREKFLLSNSHRTKKLAPTALVTGASGFIGYHLVKKLLSENIGVRALVRPNSIHAGRLTNLGLEVIQGDLADIHILDKATKGIATIYHAGSPTNDNWDEYNRVAVQGTEQLLELAIAQKVNRFVQFSSLAVYELLKIKHTQIKEDSPYQRNPKNMGPYAWAKIETEKLVYNAYEKRGLKVTIVRPGMVIGPMGRIFFPHFGFRYRDKIFVLVGKGDIVLPFTYVENTVDGIYRASISDKAIGQSYNLVDDGEITARKYLERFIETTGLDSKIVYVPFIMPYTAAGFYEMAAKLNLVKKGITSRYQLKSKQSQKRFDNFKAKSELGWIPKITMEEGLSRTFTWYRDQYRRFNW
jgi:nucleoside-diphosphate-sugar epimerase/predicted dehydrogenase